MKFRTEIDIKPFVEKIDHSSRLFSVGSCFARYMADEFRSAKFSICSNPFGVMFNPASIHSALTRIVECREFTSADMVFDRGRWFCYDLHSAFNRSDVEQGLLEANAAVKQGHEALSRADWVIITFGTAWSTRLMRVVRLSLTAIRCLQRILHVADYRLPRLSRCMMA